MLKILLSFITISVLWISALFSIDQKDAESLVQMHLFSSHKKIKPGESFDMLVRFSIQEGWHIYGQDPGDSGMATRVEWKLPKGISILSQDWPQTKLFRDKGINNNVYEKDMMIKTTFSVSPNLSPNTQIALECTAYWLVCHEECIPGRSTKNIALSLDNQSVINPNVSTLLKQRSLQKKQNTQPSAQKHSFFLILLLAFLGGLILNIMPCVLPVISFKMLSLMSSSNPNTIRKEVTFFCLGIFSSFWILAGILLLLRSWGHHYGWGFQLQSPAFIICLITLIFVFSLNMFGVCEMGMSLTRLDSSKMFALKKLQSFMNGFFATVIATPCTGSFMASALGYTITQPPWISFCVFTALALGFSFPYILLSIFPQLIKKIPKPGRWTLLIKQLMAFSLLGTTLWLLSTLVPHTDSKGLIAVLIHFFIIAFFLWIHGQSYSKKSLLLLVTSLFLSTSFLIQNIHSQKNPNQWIPFEQKAIETYRKKEHGVFVNCTATWCVTCQWNKKMVLQRQSVKKMFAAHNVILMEADWTKNDPKIMDFLQSFNVVGVPLYVYYPPSLNSKPIVLPQVLRKKMISKLFSSSKDS